MDRQEVLMLPAGDELDRLVAERIFGWTRFERRMIHGCGRVDVETLLGYPPEADNVLLVPWYSENIEDAWLVVTTITKKLDNIYKYDGTKFGYWTLDRLGFDCCKDGQPDIDNAHGQWRCWFAMDWTEDEKITAFATGDTAPLAICRAALARLLPEEEKEI